MDQPKTIRFVPARFLESFIAVARELIFRPALFFAQLRPSGSLFGLFTFIVVCLFLRWLFVANVIGANLSLFVAFFVSWVVSAVLGAVCLHAVLVSPLFKVRLPYEATLSVIAYACIVDLVAFIPLINIIANMYGLFLMYIGFKVHIRRNKFGSRRIVYELQQKGIDEELISAVLPRLKETELKTARAVWQKKFGTAPANAKERAKQIRFLMGRGFSTEIITQVLDPRDE